MSEKAIYPTCSTCKHWGESSQFDYATARYRICNAVQMQKTATEAEQATAHALTVDAEGHWSGLITAPSFGCLLHSDLIEAGA